MYICLSRCHIDLETTEPNFAQMFIETMGVYSASLPWGSSRKSNILDKVYIKLPLIREIKETLI